MSQGRNTNPVSSQSSRLFNELQGEATTVAKEAGSAFLSLAWLWPIRGLVFAIIHPQVILSVQGALVKSLGSSAILFAVLAFFTYLPQAALLSVVTGFLGPVLAILLLGAESIFLLTFLAKPLLLEPALQHVFDSTLISRGQLQLVKDGKTKFASVTDRTGALFRPLQALSRNGVATYLLTLPLNIIPVLGTISFVCINGHRAGPGWHARYFQLKGFDSHRRLEFVKTHQAEYTAFGVGALVLSFVPIIGLLFTFTNTVGAALWAADIEAKSNIIGGPSVGNETAKTK
ncbi:hypothetical protein NM688_g3801 [Phlebia brevispora]|uniref:Uncharacterized protein n=1 Tax=Phlebia brevispora TaxID=194682 RepID=A0ACC1T4Y7_9APHY|nr:hypothetical protein NM688_g3801 [Phlebia brevispora]